SLVRRVVEKAGVTWDAPAPFAPEQSLGKALLAPTRIYVASCVAAMRSGAVKAFAHITGGGFPENVPRVLPKHLGVRLDLARVPLAPVFRWLAATGGIAETEMLRTFNCGVGMVAIVPAHQADEAAASFGSGGEKVVALGKVVEATNEPRVTYDGHLDLAG